ncbi:MAG: RdgB/HAM1 family non-canonical purine NTP pyrophosphatase [Gammaproteobacteria bacterium]|uniref:RdgB/HAM1 family non-canonical purine NTP pyrophosphatase n=1 Tax=Tolumonas auensis TaxID=43948 RepID=UPI002AA87CE7|nr:RdgB/HAM1 family non-canonical purine NTP pyrophosphatase [Tolumonas auensis]NCB56965.1 RdgB/HAM1 family non-canonical purine NTP pyrophosphatase [Gammaproteobacteria bacterium]
MEKVVLATGNKKKVEELNALLADLDYAVVPQSEFNVESVPETGTTFVENAIIKARHAARVTGLPAIADDSGIEVDALLGRPGVYSARYAGEDASDEDNLEKLLEDMNGVPAVLRSARYWCVLVYMRHADDPTPIICQASWEGSLATEPVGENGFGYDPIFNVPDLDCTAAELDPATKNSLSHRGKALAKLVKALQE